MTYTNPLSFVKSLKLITNRSQKDLSIIIIWNALSNRLPQGVFHHYQAYSVRVFPFFTISSLDNSRSESKSSRFLLPQRKVLFDNCQIQIQIFFQSSKFVSSKVFIEVSYIDKEVDIKITKKLLICTIIVQTN